MQCPPECQDGESSLVQVHDGEVGALVAVDHGVGVEAHYEVAAELAAFLQEVEVTNVEQVEGSGDINNLKMELKHSWKYISTDYWFKAVLQWHRMNN